jgi:malonyl-CoA decarboxylase
MNTGQWIAERVSRLRSPAKEKAPAPRSTNERLRARLRHDGEALAPRALRQLLDQLKGVVDPMVSEVEGGRRAQALIDW